MPSVVAILKWTFDFFSGSTAFEMKTVKGAELCCIFMILGFDPLPTELSLIKLRSLCGIFYFDIDIRTKFKTLDGTHFELNASQGKISQVAHIQSWGPSFSLL